MFCLCLHLFCLCLCPPKSSKSSVCEVLMNRWTSDLGSFGEVSNQQKFNKHFCFVSARSLGVHCTVYKVTRCSLRSFSSNELKQDLTQKPGFQQNVKVFCAHFWIVKHYKKGCKNIIMPLSWSHRVCWCLLALVTLTIQKIKNWFPLI